MPAWSCPACGRRFARARHPRVVRKVVAYPGGRYHVANVRAPDQVDDALVELLVEAYHRTPA